MADVGAGPLFGHAGHYRRDPVLVIKRLDLALLVSLRPHLPL